VATGAVWVVHQRGPCEWSGFGIVKALSAEAAYSAARTRREKVETE
jgi:hypothetical protein